MAAPSAASLGQRYQFLDNLIERSSSAMQLEKRGPPEALQIRQQARDSRAKAKEALDAGDLAKANLLLNEAAQLMMKAVRMAHPEEITAEKEKTDYNNRRGSVKALLATGKRVADEKHSAKPEFTKADSLLKEAEALAETGKYMEGKAKLDDAYKLISVAVRDMRGGEQLTADKKFATKADEYKYEQSRNDDYQNLIAGVLTDKHDAAWDDMAKKARELRTDADAMAKSGEHENALKKIFESTVELKNILRRSGFPIM